MSKQQPFHSKLQAFSTYKVSDLLLSGRAGWFRAAASNRPRRYFLSEWTLGFVWRKRGCSSAGRAPDLHSGGRRFDPDQLHQFGSMNPTWACSSGGIAGRRFEQVRTPDKGEAGEFESTQAHQ